MTFWGRCSQKFVFYDFAVIYCFIDLCLIKKPTEFSKDFFQLLKTKSLIFKELFQEYNCYGVTVHYDEMGNHLGTADLFTDQKTAAEIIREFKDIAIDGYFFHNKMVRGMYRDF